MKLYIGNAFSLSMLDRETQQREVGNPFATVRIPRPVDDPIGFIANYATAGVEVISAVGHADTAAVFSAVLDRPIGVNRVSIKLTGEDRLLVGQYIGPRLPEGATTLPEGATIEWWVV